MGSVIITVAVTDVYVGLIVGRTIVPAFFPVARVQTCPRTHRRMLLLMTKVMIWVIVMGLLLTGVLVTIAISQTTTDPTTGSTLALTIAMTNTSINVDSMATRIDIAVAGSERQRFSMVLSLLGACSRATFGMAGRSEGFGRRVVLDSVF